MPPPSSDQIARTAKRLVLVTHEFFPHHGGIAIYAAEMAKAAQALGYEVEVWAPALPGGVREPVWPFTIKRLPLVGDHGLVSQWRMARHLVSQRVYLKETTLYIPEPGPLFAMLLLQYFDALQPARLMLTFYGSEIQRLASRRLLRWSTGHLLDQATGISVISGFARDLLLRHFPRAASKVVVTPGALRTDLAPHHATAAPQKLKHRVIILTVARLNPRKGQLQIIQALKALPPSQRPLIEYWLVGSHSKENYEAVLNAAAADANFHVKFLGDISDGKLDDIYRQADIFAMTSMPHKRSVEGYGLVYLEAGAHGLPVIAHNIGGVSDAVIDGKTGILIEPGDTAALTAAFSQLISDPALRRRLGEAGRIWANQSSWLDSAQSLFGQAAG